jgi:RNA polymerase sigma-70 factor (ECF subfamily)
MRDGPEVGLTHIDAVLEHGELANYYPAHSARADMYRRFGRTAEVRSSNEKALALELNTNQSGNSCRSGFGS